MITEFNWKQGWDEIRGEQRHGMKTKSDVNETKQIRHKTNMGVRTRRVIFATSFTLPPEKFSTFVCSAPSTLQSPSPTERLKLEILTPISVCGPRVGPGVGAPTVTPGYMMEQVNPQHSFSRVRPVLVKGEEVCWALDGTRLGTPGTQKKKKKSHFEGKDILQNLFWFYHVNFICYVLNSDDDDRSKSLRAPISVLWWVRQWLCEDSSFKGLKRTKKTLHRKTFGTRKIFPAAYFPLFPKHRGVNAEEWLGLKSHPANPCAAS